MKAKFTDKQLALFAIILAALFSGLLSPFTKIAVREIPVFSFSFLRFLFATISILPFFLKDKPKLQKNFYRVVLFSLLLGANSVLFPIGAALTTATIAVTIYVFIPIFVAIFSYFLAVEFLNVRKIIGLVIGLVGAIIITILPVIERFSPFSGNIQGNLIIFVGAVLTALYTVLSKKFQKSYTPLQITTFFVLVTLVCTIPLALSDFIYHPYWWHNLTLPSLGIMVYLGAFGTTAFYLLNQYAIKHGSPLIASMLLYLQPATTFVWASLLLKEQITTGFIVGTVLTFIGVYLILQTKKS